jgi:hypothetical protein
MEGYVVMIGGIVGKYRVGHIALKRKYRVGHIALKRRG